MAHRGQPIYAKYIAADASGQPVSDDEANHTLVWTKDGTPSAPTNSPTAIAGDPGAYQVLLTATETDAADGKIGGSSSTSGVTLIGQVYTFDASVNAEGRILAQSPNR